MAALRRIAGCAALAALLIAALAGGTDAGTGSNYDIVLLTPGHSRTIYYNLGDTIARDPAAFQATLVMSLGAGTLTVGVGNHSFIGAGVEMVYATAGVIGAVPVLDYAYSSSPISFTVPVGSAGIGAVFTAIMFAVGDIDFPVTMSMVFMLN